MHQCRCSSWQWRPVWVILRGLATILNSSLRLISSTCHVTVTKDVVRACAHANFARLNRNPTVA
jgi:hypothetical protein